MAKYTSQFKLQIAKATENAKTYAEVARSFPEYELDDRIISIISSASVLHDIGKISIPDSVLNKPGKLTKEEFEIMKTHTTAGCEILEGMSTLSDREYLRYAYNICRYHHERWDGGGYHDGLKGSNIPICAQVVSIADVYDALTTKRVYKDAISHSECVQMILNGECGAFNPYLLECFKRVVRAFETCANSYADGERVRSEDVHIPLPLPKTASASLNAQQMSTIKYHPLLSYIGGSIVEMDSDLNTYHLIYDESNMMTRLCRNDGFENLFSEIISNFVHPDDQNDALQFYTYFKKKFFEEGLRKVSRRSSVRPDDTASYIPVEFTFLRIDTGNPTQRKAIMVCKTIATSAASKLPAGVYMEKWGSVTLRDMMGAVLRCKNDRSQSILDGIEHFAEFLGYTPQELRRNFRSRLMEVILPEDRATVLSHAYKQLDYGTNVDVEYSLQGKNGRIIYAKDKACVIYGNDGVEYTYHAIVDNTAEKQALDLVRSTKERYQILLNQIDEVVFEWDIANDTTTFSPNFKKQFGYQPEVEGFSARIMAGNAFIHSDDIKILQNQIHNIRENQDYPSFVGADFRIRTVDGNYVWRRLRANAQQMENGKIECIMGSLIDINRTTTPMIADKADQDALTKLYNLRAAKDRIGEYLADRRIGEHSALLLIDLDNFNKANHRHGRLAGDAFLLQCADLLTTMFYNEDIIARIGGDAFDELFRRAEQALYMAKLRENDGQAFSFYRQDNNISVYNSITSLIENDEFPGLAEHGLVYDAFNRLYQSGDVEAAIQSILETIGRQMNVSRVYIFENNADNTTCSNVFEWCGEGIESQMANLQDISYETDVPGWMEQYNEQGVFLCEDISTLPDSFRAILEPQGIKSMLHCAIIDEGVF